MRKHLPTLLLVLVFLVGLSLLLYPTVSDYLNTLHSTRAITDYVEQVADLDDELYEEILESAREYNEKLQHRPWSLELKEEADIEEYQAELNVGGSGQMGYIEIPNIDCLLPIYHGTSDGTLARNVGHLEGSSLPVGGESTHCVLSGHRGLPSARLFTDLDRLVEGDTFLLHILDKTLTYEVDQIRIVEPEDTEELAIVEGKDYCTLVTCTPYGVNSHRLLVRGHRIENQAGASNVRVTADAMQIEPVMVAPIVAAPVLLLLLIGVLFKTRKRKERRSL